MFFKKKNIQVKKIYQNIVEISRSKFFYLDLKLSDDFETRFDLIIFHAFIIFFYYKSLNDKNQAFLRNSLTLCLTTLKITLERWVLEILQ